jgi:hypothetical protein
MDGYPLASTWINTLANVFGLESEPLRISHPDVIPPDRL